MGISCICVHFIPFSARSSTVEGHSLVEEFHRLMSNSPIWAGLSTIEGNRLVGEFHKLVWTLPLFLPGPGGSIGQ